MDATAPPESELEVGSAPVASAPNGFPPAGLRACMGAVSKVWKVTGPDFFFEQLDDVATLRQGDFVLTVIFHLKDKPRLIELDDAEQNKMMMPELCASFLVCVADRGPEEEAEEAAMAAALQVVEQAPSEPEAPVDLLSFQDPPPLVVLDTIAGEQPPTSTPDDQVPDGPPPPPPPPRPVLFELFGDGVSSTETVGLSWSFVTPGMASLQHLRIIATSSFRHRYDDELTRMSFNRVECVERCRVLNMPDMPFPTELVNGNLDLLANLLMLGLVPVTVAPQLSEELERRSLARGIVTLEQMTRKADPSHRLRMKKPSVIEIASKLKPLHHLLHTGAPHAFRIGHVGLIIESGVVVGGAAYDAVYDPQNLMSNVKRRSKLAAASTVGGLVAGGLSLLIPIPGLFIPVSMAGSVAARWIAGKFITEDGKELKDVVPVGRLREDEEGVLEVVQEMEEDDPKWKIYFNKVQDRYEELQGSLSSTSQTLGPDGKPVPRSMSAVPKEWVTQVWSKMNRATSAPAITGPQQPTGDLLAFVEEAAPEAHPSPRELRAEDLSSGGGSDSEPERAASSERDDPLTLLHAASPARQAMMGSPDVPPPSLAKPAADAPPLSWWSSAASAAPSAPVATPAARPTAAAAAASSAPSSSWWGGSTLAPPPPQPSSAPSTRIPQASASAESSWWGIFGTHSPAPVPPSSQSPPPMRPPSSQSPPAVRPPPPAAAAPVEPPQSTNLLLFE